ncbi:hypothetical protein ONS96_002833 [Cadophora gregata f. sp. sojae]|nr:hypothetical protein ONS96_002833 [Cadophora gregata f. sp. sojae]
MTYKNTNSSSPRPRGLPKKAARDTHMYPSNSASISQQSDNERRASSDRLQHGISFNLVSLVTKFEALDALSLPFTTPSFQPAPLQLSRNSPIQKGGKGAGYRRRLSTIFSPKRGSSEKRDNRSVEEDIQPAYTDIFESLNSRKLGLLGTKADSRKLKKAQTSYKPSSIKLRGGVWDTADFINGRKFGTVAAPYIENEKLDDNKGGSIRDKIKFYDGSKFDCKPEEVRGKLILFGSSIRREQHSGVPFAQQHRCPKHPNLYFPYSTIGQKLLPDTFDWKLETDMLAQSRSRNNYTHKIERSF